ncbi:MAG: hypothetical protein IJI45_18355 [Anaerolineaceae bacterium]|nr:hypothetical protein [Anaerolineaceae bacterium]
MFVGLTKLNLTAKQTGRLTLTLFNKLYAHYKDSWDMEMRMTQANVTYAELAKKAMQDEEWF